MISYLLPDLSQSLSPTALSVIDAIILLHFLAFALFLVVLCRKGLKSDEELFKQEVAKMERESKKDR